MESLSLHFVYVDINIKLFEMFVGRLRSVKAVRAGLCILKMAIRLVRGKCSLLWALNAKYAVTPGLKEQINYFPASLPNSISPPADLFFLLAHNSVGVIYFKILLMLLVIFVQRIYLSCYYGEFEEVAQGF